MCDQHVSVFQVKLSSRSPGHASQPPPLRGQAGMCYNLMLLPGRARRLSKSEAGNKATSPQGWPCLKVALLGITWVPPSAASQAPFNVFFQQEASRSSPEDFLQVKCLFGD